MVANAANIQACATKTSLEITKFWLNFTQTSSSDETIVFPISSPVHSEPKIMTTMAKCKVGGSLLLAGISINQKPTLEQFCGKATHPEELEVIILNKFRHQWMYLFIDLVHSFNITTALLHFPRQLEVIRETIKYDNFFKVELEPMGHKVRLGQSAQYFVCPLLGSVTQSHFSF